MHVLQMFANMVIGSMWEPLLQIFQHNMQASHPQIDMTTRGGGGALLTKLHTTLQTHKHECYMSFYCPPKYNLSLSPDKLINLLQHC